MRFSAAALLVALFLVSACHVTSGRPLSDAPIVIFFDGNNNANEMASSSSSSGIVYKRADGGANQQALVMARLQELLGAEAFAENDSHGRLSNLQRLG